MVIWDSQLQAQTVHMARISRFRRWILQIAWNLVLKAPRNDQQNG